MLPCPLCGTYLSESDLIKRNVKYMGSTEIEYDARCPRCSKMIGHVSWGQFTPLPALDPESDSDIADAPENEPADTPTPLIPPPKEIRPIVGRGKPALVKKKTKLKPTPPSARSPEPQPAQNANQQPNRPKDVRVCPHCGQIWPESEEESKPANPDR